MLSTLFVPFWQFQLSTAKEKSFSRGCRRQREKYRQTNTAFPQCPCLSSKEQAYREKSFAHNLCARSGFPPGFSSQRTAKRHDSTRPTRPVHLGPSVCLPVLTHARAFMQKNECTLYVCGLASFLNVQRFFDRT